jgi:hypothetical protein
MISKFLFVMFASAFAMCYLIGVILFVKAFPVATFVGLAVIFLIVFFEDLLNIIKHES